jgi:hypothetical protein
MLAAVLALAACDNQPPAFVERSEVSNTDIEDGPYEVRALLRDVSGIASVRVLYAPQGGLADDRGLSEMVLVGENPETGRYAGLIPGFPLGTEIAWGVEACDTRGNCGIDPPLYPASPFRFRVGLVPSDPLITSVNPSSGPSSGGTRVVIDGDDFRPGAEVRFGDQPAPHVEWIDKGRVVARTPAHEPDTVDVVLRNPDTLEAVAAGAFTFTPSPILFAVTPAEGPTAGGTLVLLEGVNFTEGVRAFFDGVACRHLERLSDSLLQCETPPGAEGFVDVEVEALDGGFGALEDGFLYIAPPVVDDVQPDRGTDLGGTVIEVIGENFDEGAVVVVGGQPCAQTIYIDEETLQCTVPAGTPGIVDVDVINEDGQSDTMIGGFNFIGPPVVIQVLPPLGPVAGDVEIRLIGAGFSEDMLVTFGGSPAEILEVNDDLEIVINLPPTTLPLFPAPDSGLAPVDVFVQKLDPLDMRSDLLEDGFSYIWPPEVFEVIPPSGPTEGGTPVTIIGRFFREIPPAPIEAFFGEEPAQSVAVLSSTSLSAITPPGPPGFVNVTVRNYPNSEGTLEDGYLYIPPPEVIDVVPGQGPTFGGETVTIVGEFFQPGAIVIFEGVGACLDVIFVSDQELTCVTPPSPVAGFVDVTVINPDGQQDTGDALYEYVPVIVEPDFGLEGGFTSVRIRAAGIDPNATIRFGPTIASDCTWISPTEVRCQTPPRTGPGWVEVSFTNPNGNGDAAEQGFEYRRYSFATDGRMTRTFSATNHVEAGDLDNDGDLDIVAANGSPFAETDIIYINDGSANFSDIGLGNIPRTSFSVDFGNWNNDDLLDIVVSATELGGAAIFENLGDMNFVERNIPNGQFGTPSGAFDAQFTDLVGNNFDDLLILNIGCSNDPDFDCSDFSVGADAFFERVGNNGQYVDRSDEIPHDLGLVHDHKIADPDLDGDGDRDLVLFVDNGTPAFASVGNDHRVLYNRINEGLGFVEDRTPFDGLVGDVFGVAYGDIDGDNDPDVLAGNCEPSFGSSEIVYVNQGGVLERSFTALPAENNNCDWGVHVWDADSDGDLDAAWIGDDGGTVSLRIYVNDGTGTFHPSFLSVPAFPNVVQQTRGAEIASGNFDNDDDVDLVLGLAELPAAGAGGSVELLLLEQVDPEP